MALRTVADDGDLLGLDQAGIGIGIIINAHSVFSLLAVIPAEAGIQSDSAGLDPGLRRGDG
jgi:hypothetical protein